MIRCDIEFKKDGLIAEVHPSTKKLITDDICARLAVLKNEMDLYPQGHILAQYENGELLLHITGYPEWLADKMEKAIRLPQIPHWNSN
jgi:hypothetical protein